MLAQIGGIIAWLAGLVVLFKLFQTKGILHGLMGLVCMLYTFIWGWMNISKEELKLKTWMYAWTGAIVLGIVLGIIGAVTSGSGS